MKLVDEAKVTDNCMYGVVNRLSKVVHYQGLSRTEAEEILKKREDQGLEGVFIVVQQKHT